MKLTGFEKVKDGKYLKNYELTYENKKGNPKKYEIVSRHELADVSQVGNHTSGISIVATVGDRIVLLKEFRMGVNRCVYNLVAGMLEPGESPEDCIRRELYEETGLRVKEIREILRPSYAAVAIADIKTQIAFVEAEGEFEDHTSDNEMIEAALYNREEVLALLQKEDFSSRAQIAAYSFAHRSL